jgi:hypothetical protein
MLNNKKVSGPSVATDGPSVGSLFVPTRVLQTNHPQQHLQQQQQQNTVKDSTVCRIASLQRVPVPSDYGLDILAPQKPIVQAAPGES